MGKSSISLLCTACFSQYKVLKVFKIIYSHPVHLLMPLMYVKL